MRIALLTLEGLAAASAVRRFVLRDPARLALVALSDPFRASAGGSLGQTRKRLAASGPRILPYLGLNFTAPRLAGAVRRVLGPLTPEETPLAETCARLGVPVETVDDVNAPAFAERLRASGAELILTFHFDQILRAPVIASAPRGGINVHCGLLSSQRGPTPTIQALLEAGPPRWGFTIHALTPRIDAGAVLAEQEVALPPHVSALTAARLLHEAALPALEAVLAGRAAAPVAERGEAPSAGRYHTFPTAAELRGAARRGRRLADWRDVVEAWRTPM